jgi:uncharacterized protein (TIGR02271 family)
MESTTQSYDAWIGRDAYGRDGDKIGEIAGIYYDEVTGRPEWIAVRTGLFGMNVSFAPIAGSTNYGDDLQLAFEKDTVKDAPNVDPDGHLNADEEQRLFDHYQFDWSGDQSYGDTARADSDFAFSDEDRDASRDDAMTRSEEQLRVATEREASGRVRLRKYVVTEHQNVTVPVSREEVRVEREPITDANIDEALSGPDLTESEHEVTTYQERPVVTTETVPKERVRLAKDTVVEDETVGADVRKEHIEVEGDTDRIVDR